MNNFKVWYAHKRVLVTGGAGFIGSHLVEQLVRLGAHVTVLDNLSTGSLANLEQLQKNINLNIGDITNEETCAQAVRGNDVIFHLAAFVSVPESVEKPDDCNAINVDGTQNLCAAAIQNDVASFVFSSSSAVYGERNSVCTETDEPQPQSPYAVSKLEGEKLSKQLALKAKTSTTCLRYFNVYGPRQNPDGHYAAVVAKFVEKLKNGEPITIFGDGKQTRDFVHVDTVVRANLAAGMRTNGRGEAINVASGTSINLFQLLEKLEDETGQKHSHISFQPARGGDVTHSAANCGRLRKLLSGTALVSDDKRVQEAFEDILERYDDTLKKLAK